MGENRVFRYVSVETYLDPPKNSSGTNDVISMSVLGLSSVVQYSSYCGLQWISCLLKA